MCFAAAQNTLYVRVTAGPGSPPPPESQIKPVQSTIMCWFNTNNTETLLLLILNCIGGTQDRKIAKACARTIEQVMEKWTNKFGMKKC
jgi:hypothetical protein